MSDTISNKLEALSEQGPIKLEDGLRFLCKTVCNVTLGNTASAQVRAARTLAKTTMSARATSCLTRP